MIDLRGGELADLLSQPFNDTDMICLSHAVKKCTKHILSCADIIRTNAYIDGLPGYILDILAQEMRAPYYREDMELEAKREIIKGSVKWQYTAGTKSAVEELLTAVFGGGEITEWNEFEEPPYTPGTFDAITSMPLSQVGIENFLRIIKDVKNERSHLRKVGALRQFKVAQNAAVGAQTWANYEIKLGIQTGLTQRAAAGAETYPKYTVIIQEDY